MANTDAAETYPQFSISCWGVFGPVTCFGCDELESLASVRVTPNPNNEFSTAVKFAMLPICNRCLDRLADHVIERRAARG